MLVPKAPVSSGTVVRPHYAQFNGKHVRIMYGCEETAHFRVWSEIRGAAFDRGEIPVFGHLDNRVGLYVCMVREGDHSTGHSFRLAAFTRSEFNIA